MGYKVFYDIESLSSGKFNAKLLEVIDETAPQYDMEELLQENEGNLLGEYIRRFKDCEKDSIEYQALYEGVEVLLKNKG